MQRQHDVRLWICVLVVGFLSLGAPPTSSPGQRLLAGQTEDKATARDEAEALAERIRQNLRFGPTAPEAARVAEQLVALQRVRFGNDSLELSDALALATLAHYVNEEPLALLADIEEAISVLMHVDHISPGQQRFAQLMEQLALLAPAPAALASELGDQLEAMADGMDPAARR